MVSWSAVMLNAHILILLRHKPVSSTTCLVIIWRREININQNYFQYNTFDCPDKNCNYYQLFLSHVPWGGTRVAFSLFVAARSLHARSEGVKKQGQISTSADDSHRERTSWPDESHFLEEPFIYWVIMKDCTLQYFLNIISNRQEKKKSEPASFLFFVASIVPILPQIWQFADLKEMRQALKPQWLFYFFIFGIETICCNSSQEITVALC